MTVTVHVCVCVFFFIIWNWLRWIKAFTGTTTGRSWHRIPHTAAERQRLNADSPAPGAGSRCGKIILQIHNEGVAGRVRQWSL